MGPVIYKKIMKCFNILMVIYGIFMPSVIFLLYELKKVKQNDFLFMANV